AGRRFARAEELQLRARLLSLLRLGHRHLRDDLSDTGLPRARARLQRVRDRPDRLLDRAFPARRDSHLRRPGQAHRSALLMFIGLTLFAVGLWKFTPITHEWGWRELLLPQALRGFSQQFAVAPIVTLTLGGLAPDRLKLASGLFNLMRNLGGAIGIAACGTILNDRANLHFLRLAEHLNTGNQAMADRLRR